MRNGEMWYDDAGQPIQAHGGMIARFGDKWYWYGENKGAPNCPGTTRVDVIGVSCYSSRDLRVWHHEGVVLRADGSAPALRPDRVLERPKVLYNPGTGQYVMWFHADTADYTLAQAGCAVSDSPTGPFRFLHAQQPNRLDCRDMTLFVDQERRAWLVHSANWNKTLYFSRLTEDYLGFTGETHAALIDQEREAPALIWHDGLYYCVTSGCTGWNPNSALYAVSPHVSCGWKLIDNPCSGPQARQTFRGQSTWMFAHEGQVYLMLDHWKPQDLQSSGYSLLPVTLDGLTMEIPWTDTILE
ncbi:MAG: glycoside hydrolase family 43 protein [Aristaeellaceae bacterium]